MNRILIINGPNLNLLGKRESIHYGQRTLADIEKDCRTAFPSLQLDFFQSNHEGEIIDRIQAAEGQFDAIIINAGGYTHSSVAIADAVKDSPLPFVEIHISNISARESFRHNSLISPHVEGVVFGFGPVGYEIAINASQQLGR